MIYFWVFMVAALATGTEYYFRITNYTFWQIYPFFIPFQALLAYGVWRIVQSVDSYMEIIILLPLGTMGLRFLIGLAVLREMPSTTMWVGLLLIITANIVRMTIGRI